MTTAKKEKSTPSVWRWNDRNKAKEIALKLENKLKGKKLVKVDKKTWVYVSENEEPKHKSFDLKKYKIEINTKEPVKNKSWKPVKYNGVTYSSVREFAEKNNISVHKAYRMFK